MGGEVTAPVAAQHAEGEVCGAGRPGGGEAGVGVLLELERDRPVVLDRIPEPVQRPDPGVPAPGEDELAGGAHPDQLVVDQVRRHPDQRQVAPSLPDQLVPRGLGNEVREPFEGDGIPVANELGDRLVQGYDPGHHANLSWLLSPVKTVF